MTLPALDLLAASGFAMTLAGRPWAGNLFAAYPWKVVPLTGSHSKNIRALRPFKGHPGLLMTNSFGTALEFRLAGIAATGYARDARSWLLREALPVHAHDHMVEYYYRLAVAVTRTAADAPRDFRLRLRDSDRQHARDLLAMQGARSPYIVLCPLAVGFHRGKVKAWKGFTPLNRELIAAGRQVIAMPGPNETPAVSQMLPGAMLLPESDIATFAAVLAGAQLVVANDSGPGHLAAAVGARLISVFGVTEPEQTHPWSTRASLIGSNDGWPDYADVRCAVDAALRT